MVLFIAAASPRSKRNGIEIAKTLAAAVLPWQRWRQGALGVAPREGGILRIDGNGGGAALGDGTGDSVDGAAGGEGVGETAGAAVGGAARGGGRGGGESADGQGFGAELLAGGLFRGTTCREGEVEEVGQVGEGGHGVEVDEVGAVAVAVDNDFVVRRGAIFLRGRGPCNDAACGGGEDLHRSSEASVHAVAARSKPSAEALSSGSCGGLDFEAVGTGWDVWR